MKKKTSILRGQKGVSFIELLIVMTLVVIVLTMNTDTFGVIFRQSRQQTQAVGAQMDRVVGLEILRTDLEHAGFGLPWSFQSAINYDEATASPQNTFNDSPSNPPRAFVSGNDPSTFTLNNSDYLVIKSTIVGTNNTSQQWTYITGGQQPHVWNSNDLSNGDRVIVLWPRSVTGFSKELIMDGADFFTTYSSSAFPATFSPAAATARFVIYGVDPDTNLRMPFNRADYYIQRPASIPQACALNTGILYKATINQGNGARNPEPLIDCVADMQVIYRLDNDNNGTIDSTVNDISGLTAQQVRERVKEVRVYILSHEGQSDSSFKYRNSTITVGEFGVGRTFNLSATIGSGWENYRWKVSTLVVKPRNLAS
jgi:type II secretory pathway pseudopilin PulG